MGEIQDRQLCCAQRDVAEEVVHEQVAEQELLVGLEHEMAHQETVCEEQVVQAEECAVQEVQEVQDHQDHLPPDRAALAHQAHRPQVVQRRLGLLARPHR